MRLFKIVAGVVKPEGSGSLPFGPKNHLKVGGGISSSGKGGFLLVTKVAEQVSE